MRQLRWIGTLFLASALSGCATYGDIVSEFDASPVTSSGVDAIPYETLPAGTVVSVKMDESAPVVALPSGKTRIRGFLLPKPEVPYRIVLKSFVQGETVKKGYLFFPRAAVLDDRFAEIQATKAGDFLFSKAGTGETAEASWTSLPYKAQGSLTLTGEAGEKYLVVYTTDELRRGSAALTQQVFVPIFVPGSVIVPIPTGMTEAVNVPFAPEGVLTLEAETGE